VKFDRLILLDFSKAIGRGGLKVELPASTSSSHGFVNFVGNWDVAVAFCKGTNKRVTFRLCALQHEQILEQGIIFTSMNTALLRANYSCSVCLVRRV
jgi:hypothetical protein